MLTCPHVFSSHEPDALCGREPAISSCHALSPSGCRRAEGAWFHLDGGVGEFCLAPSHCHSASRWLSIRMLLGGSRMPHTQQVCKRGFEIFRQMEC